MYPHDPRDARDVDIDAINSKPHYAMHVVLATHGGFHADTQLLDVSGLPSALEECGVEVRGFYDVAGFRADADLLVWMLSEDPRNLQAAYRKLQQSDLGVMTEFVWSVISVHRPAEFNTYHIPACLGGVVPREWLVVYPFVRSFDWYCLPEEERSQLLKEHGMAARPYPDVKASTMASFALGDYEWILSFEADELHRLTDAMRHQRSVAARLHVREETPFFTGQRVTLDEWLARRSQ